MRTPVKFLSMLVLSAFMTLGALAQSDAPDRLAGLQFVDPADVITDLDNPTVAAIIAYMNLLDRPQVLEFEEAGFDGGPLAVLLLETLVRSGVIEPVVYSALLTLAIEPEAVLPRDLLPLFVIDVVTGVEPLPQALTRLGLTLVEGDTIDLAAVLAEFAVLGSVVDDAIQVEVPGLRIPPGDGQRNISSAAVTQTVLEILDDPDAVAAARERYRDAISPIADTTLTTPR